MLLLNLERLWIEPWAPPTARKGREFIGALHQFPSQYSILKIYIVEDIAGNGVRTVAGHRVP